MFLHSGASIHGHEYSGPRPSPQRPARRVSFLQSALRPPSEPFVRPPAPVHASTSPLPRPISYHENAPILGSVSPRTTRPRPTSEYMPRRELSVRFREPETDDELPDGLQSEDEGSTAFSDISDLSDSSTTVKKRTRRKRTPRKSTQFLLAHPAPRLRTKQRKIVVRPRLLLQLQELTEKRPVPAFDILPSSLVMCSSVMPRIAKRCPKLFQSKPVLGLNDLIIVRSEDYGAPDHPNSSDVEDSLDQRDLMAVLSPMPHMGDDNAEIVMEDGCTWESSLMANGSYEFIGVDERGRISTARWIKKPVVPAQSTLRTSPTGTPPTSPTPPEFKWTFSLIHPDTRRHPIMGTLLSNTLEVFDTYNTMSTSSGRYPPTRSTVLAPGAAPEWVATPPSAIEGRLTKAVPEDIKLLMLVTATWVTLRQEGWPASLRTAPATLQKRNPSGVQSRPSSAGALQRSSPLSSNPPMRMPLVAPSPSPSISDPSSCDMAPPRRSLSSTPGFVKKMVAPRASEDGRRPTMEQIVFQEPSRPPTRRLSVSVRQMANKIFRRRSSSAAQQQQHDDPFRYKLDYPNA